MGDRPTGLRRVSCIIARGAASSCYRFGTHESNSPEWRRWQENGSEEEEKEEKKPTPKKKSGPENVEVAVGETAELQDRSLVVNEVQHGYPPPRQIRMEPGNELLRVYVTLRNTSDQEFSYNPLNFKVQDSNGVQESRQVIPDLPYRIEPGSLAPDGTMEGNLAFEVPQGDSNLQLIYEANPITKQNITWTCIGSVDCLRLRTVRGKE